MVNKHKLMNYFENITPEDSQKERMKKAILTEQQQTNSNIRKKWRWNGTKIFTVVISLALVLYFTLYTPANIDSVVYGVSIIDPNDSIVTLEDYAADHNDGSAFVNHVNARPDLRFFIDGENIAKIEITTDTEYITAKDWTETQHEKYWNTDYFQHFDEEQETYVADFDLIYDKQLTMTFDKDFSDYDQIWFEWNAWDLYKWAAADDFAYFLGYGIKLADLSEEQKLKLASGEGTGVGHIQLDEYPDHLKEDTITIKITDHDGQETVQTIHVSVSNNEIRQTVVKASLGN